MTRPLLFIGLAVSLLVPTLALSVFFKAATTPVQPPAPGAEYGSEFDGDTIIAIHNELEALGGRATPGSAGQSAEARRIAREARAWSVDFDAEAEWEEFALAAGALAAVLTDGLEHPERFSAADYDREKARLVAARDALPDERRPANRRQSIVK